MVKLIHPYEYEALWDETMKEAKKFDVGSAIIYQLPYEKFHGSAAAIRCYESERCDVDLEIVLPRDRPLLNVVKKDIELLGCYVYDIHEHPAPEDTFHVHAICNVDVEKVDDILKYIKNL